MFLSLGLIALGLIMLALGGELLLRGAVGLATPSRLTPAVIGLTVVAAGTSVPELAVSLFAAYDGKVDIAVGNVVGSNIFNVTIVVGLSAIIRPMMIVGNTIKLEYPVLVLVTLLCLVIVQDGTVNRLDGILCVAVYVGFTAYMVSLVRQQVTSEEARELGEEVSELAVETGRPRLWLCLLLTAAGIALLSGGAQATVSGAADLARMIGWSERLIGLTVVAAGTGLPEVVASLVSSIRGRSDVALGNVIGSNLFNILAILGLSSVVAPLPVQEDIIASDCWWMMATTLLLLPILLTGLRVSRWEGVVLGGVYAVYLALLIRLGT